MSQRVRLHGKRTVPTYTTLRAVSWYAFRLAETDPRARLNHLMTSMAFSAFMLEAYLNHLGPILIEFWEPLKRKLSPDEKLSVIASRLGIELDLGTRPWQTFKSIFQLRSHLVHAQTETLEFEEEVSTDSTNEFEVPLARWERFMTLELGLRFLDDSKAMIKDLARQAGLDPDEVFAKDSIEAATTPLDDSGEPDS